MLISHQSYRGFYSLCRMHPDRVMSENVSNRFHCFFPSLIYMGDTSLLLPTAVLYCPRRTWPVTQPPLISIITTPAAQRDFRRATSGWDGPVGLPRSKPVLLSV